MTYHSERPVPTSFAALVAACRLAYDSKAPQVSAILDPAEFLALARRHRVQGIAWRGLGKTTTDLDQHKVLGADATEIARDNLWAADSAALIAEDFRRAGQSVKFVKGLALSSLVYGDAFVKMSADIDLLVAPHRVVDAARLLEERGFRAALPTRTPLTDWHAIHKESVWVADGRPTVELHSRLADHPSLLKNLTAEGPGDIVTIAPGLELPTLPRDRLPAYLAVHGSSSLWFRLKWLADFAGLIAGSDASPDPRGAGPCLEEALRLSHRLFDTPFIGRENGLLTTLSMSQLRNPTEPTERFLGTATIHLGQVLMGGGTRFAVSDLLRQVRTTMVRT